MRLLLIPISGANAFVDIRKGGRVIAKKCLLEDSIETHNQELNWTRAMQFLINLCCGELAWSRRTLS